MVCETGLTDIRSSGRGSVKCDSRGHFPGSRPSDRVEPSVCPAIAHRVETPQDHGGGSCPVAGTPDWKQPQRQLVKIRKHLRQHVKIRKLLRTQRDESKARLASEATACRWGEARWEDTGTREQAGRSLTARAEPQARRHRTQRLGAGAGWHPAEQGSSAAPRAPLRVPHAPSRAEEDSRAAASARPPRRLFSLVSASLATAHED